MKSHSSFEHQRAFAAGLPATPLPEPSAPEPPEPARSPKPEEPSRISRRWLALPFMLGVIGGYSLYQQQAPQQAAQTASVGPILTMKVARGDLRKTLRVGGTVSAERSSAVVAPRLRGRDGGGGGGGGRGQLVLLSMAPGGAMVKKSDVVAEFDRQHQLRAIDDQHALVVQAQADIDKSKAQHAIEMETAQQQVRTSRAAWDKAMLDLRTAEVRSEIEAEILKLAVEETEAAYRQLKEEAKLLKDSHEADLRALEIARNQLKLQESRARINSEQMVLRAGIDGMVVLQTVYRGSGQFSQVQEGDELRPGSFFMAIVDTSSMILNGQLNQVDSQLVRVGQRAEIHLDAYPDKVWPGRVTSVGAIAGAGSGGRGGPRSSMTRTDYVRAVPVTFAIEAQAKEIIPDLSGSADVLIEDHEDVLTVPLEAVQEDDSGETIVYVRQPGTNEFERRPVKLGASSKTDVIVENGLEEGEEIALEPPREIANRRELT